MEAYPEELQDEDIDLYSNSMYIDSYPAKL